MIESELFGYKKSAFTGAAEHKPEFQQHQKKRSALSLATVVIVPLYH